MARPDLYTWTLRSLDTRRMRNTFSALFLYLMIGTSQGHEKRQSLPTHELEEEFGIERVKRQLPPEQNVYQYVYYTDITLEGYASDVAEASIASQSIVPYTVLINSTLNVTFAQIAITTECNVTDTGKMCACNDGYIWNITVCYTYRPCSNSSSFCSCLLILDNNIPYCESPHNISHHRVIMYGSITLNETFTTDLLDPTSVNYQALQSNITLVLLNVYTKNCNPLRVSVFGFRFRKSGPFAFPQGIQDVRKLGTKKGFWDKALDAHLMLSSWELQRNSEAAFITGRDWRISAFGTPSSRSIDRWLSQTWIALETGTEDKKALHEPTAEVYTFFRRKSDLWSIGSFSRADSSDRKTAFFANLTTGKSTFGVAYIGPMELEVKYWDPIQLTCEINETINYVNWFLTTNNITNIIYSGGNNVNILTQVQSDKTISVLLINKADVYWEGTYICQFYNETLVHEAFADVNVILLPAEIIVNPIQKTLTAQDTSQLLLDCCVPFDGEKYNVTWTYSNITLQVQPGKRTDLKCYSLSPPRPYNDTIYICTFTNKAGQQKESSIPVTVIQVGDTYCGIDITNGVTWNLTKADMSVTATCPSGKFGYLTRNCSAGGVWLMVQDNCINQILQTALNNAQALEEGLGSSQIKVPEIIQQMSNSNGTLINNTAEVSAMATILGTISRIAFVLKNTFDSDVITDFLRVANNLTDPSYTPLWSTGKCLPASIVLQAVERFGQLLRADNGSFEIELENIQLKGNAYEMGKAGQDYEKNFDKLGMSVSIDQHTISSLLQKDKVKITSIAFNTIGSLLPNSTEKFKDSQLNSFVQSTSIRLSDSISASSNILMSFKTNMSDTMYSQHCVFWDFSLSGSGAWSDVGCTSRVEDNITYCSCSHLTSFAVLMSIDVEPLALIEELTYAGLGVSILSLCICILVEWYVWKSVVRTNISYFRHISLVNIAMSLLCADICFLSSAFPSVITKKLICLSITYLNHFFYLALFFWTFAQSVMLLHQLLFVFHHLRKRVYVSLSFLVGYLIPAIIAAGTFLYFHPKDRYCHEKLCWLNPASGAIYAFAIPAGSIIVFNFLTLLVVIAMLSRPSVSDKNHPEDRDTAKSILKAILVLTPVFGLTWSFGFALLTELDFLTKQIFTYGFAAMNAFQGFFILLTCITERKSYT
ncbi:adhesion G-protein coupled receptor F3-like [Rhinoderma darwinii]|uniref:adhesion G-protein coupled receptor F3-like n=1 Tax=Rhinoderma darwinii TaxID=43563 RepID=UPI003F6745DE